jgi:hypothetical protein
MRLLVWVELFVYPNDGCMRVIEVGEAVRYHLRLDLLYCAQCQGELK